MANEKGGLGYEEMGLCPHGRLPGICTECLKTFEGQEKRDRISLEAQYGGSVLAQKLERETDIKPYDVLIVLGAGFKEPASLAHLKKLDQSTANSEKRGWLLNYESRFRLNAAAKLYFEGRARVLLLTGGRGVSEQWKNEPSLAELGKKYLIEKFHIPEEDILMETQSDATHGNLAHGLRELHQKGLPVSSVAIISSEYHVERARKMAELSGVETDVISAEGQLIAQDPHFQEFVEYARKRTELEPEDMTSVRNLDINSSTHLDHYLSAWQRKAYDKKSMNVAEGMKMEDEKYWRERSLVFTTPLDQEVPPVDIMDIVKKNRETIERASGEAEKPSF